METNYLPETAFKSTPDSRLVYNLKQDCWRKGEPVMTNDVAVSIEARHLPVDQQVKIAEVIRNALNAAFPTSK